MYSLCNEPDVKLHVFQQIYTPSVNWLTSSYFSSLTSFTGQFHSSHPIFLPAYGSNKLCQWCFMQLLNTQHTHIRTLAYFEYILSSVHFLCRISQVEKRAIKLLLRVKMMPLSHPRLKGSEVKGRANRKLVDAISTSPRLWDTSVI